MKYLKKVYDRNEEINGEVIENETPYKVEAEVGKFYFKTHSIENEVSTIFDTSKNFFDPLRSSESFRTVCFNELLVSFACDESYRKTEDKINRICWQKEDITQSRTIANVVDREGLEIEQAIEEKHIKSKGAIEGLINYFDRNWSYIPCYALRKKLGLRNSSNRVEKVNDLTVTERQKHNGMSWSKSGSSSLASIVILHQNGEQINWLLKKEIEFLIVNKKDVA
jgi:hypothetical protein